jgi:hypothetical protein
VYFELAIVFSYLLATVLSSNPPNTSKTLLKGTSEGNLWLSIAGKEFAKNKQECYRTILYVANHGNSQNIATEDPPRHSRTTRLLDANVVKMILQI